jgi:uncharacterized membrane protein
MYLQTQFVAEIIIVIILFLVYLRAKLNTHVAITETARIKEQQKEAKDKTNSRQIEKI